MKKLELKGWVEGGDTGPYTNVPSKCPKCGSALWKVNALQTFYPVIQVGCKNLRCRWSEIYGEKEGPDI